VAGRSLGRGRVAGGLVGVTVIVGSATVTVGVAVPVTGAPDGSSTAEGRGELSGTTGGRTSSVGVGDGRESTGVPFPDTGGGGSAPEPATVTPVAAVPVGATLVSIRSSFPRDDTVNASAAAEETTATLAAAARARRAKRVPNRDGARSAAAADPAATARGARSSAEE
jgi:hypothetical protein